MYQILENDVALCLLNFVYNSGGKIGPKSAIKFEKTHGIDPIVAVGPGYLKYDSRGDSFEITPKGIIKIGMGAKYQLIRGEGADWTSVSLPGILRKIGDNVNILSYTQFTKDGLLVEEAEIEGKVDEKQLKDIKKLKQFNLTKYEN